MFATSVDYSSGIASLGMVQLMLQVTLLLKSKRFANTLNYFVVCRKPYSPHQRCICGKGGSIAARFFLTVMEHRTGRTSFFKLYFSAQKVTPPSRIYLYYNGRPLYCPAMFDRDRYSFALPKNLEEKMVAGELFADLRYIDLPEHLVISGKRVRVPESIVLCDRYE
jgi:hypothetical protein